MFQWFSRHKINYRKGQVAPFLIAIIAFLLVLLLVTINLGQVALIKTDVSNAADAAAISGASVLSGALLGIGMKNDMLTGKSLGNLGMAILAFALGAMSVILFLVGVIAAIVILLVHIIGFYAGEMPIAFGEGKMAWTNAKKTAVQYAFQNLGVDEPRPTYAEFLQNMGGETNISYQQYSGTDLTDFKRVNQFSQSGFSRFMTDDKNGHWKESFGRVNPSSTSLAIIESGYGWNNKVELHNGVTRRANSYDDGENFKNYDNWVNVRIIGNILYSFSPYSFFSILTNPAGCLIDWLLSLVNVDIPWYLEAIFNNFIEWTLGLFFKMLTYIYPTSLSLKNEDAQIDRNKITVEVSRHIKEKDMGLWTFKYGGSMINPNTITSKAIGRAYRQWYLSDTVVPKNTANACAATTNTLFVPCNGNNICDVFLSMLKKLVNKESNSDSIAESFMNSPRHLMETELVTD